MDKWLWAARFFKTRALAARACELGQDYVEWTAGEKCPPGSGWGSVTSEERRR